jgi:glycerol-3-phosphate cytidylyltransferase-like family protein
MSDNEKKEPSDRLDALLAIIRDPKAAEKLAEQMATLERAKIELNKRRSETVGREKHLDDRDEMLNRVEAEQQRERDRIAAQEASLADRANKIKAAEDKLQADIVAHGQDIGRRSAELNSREQKVTKREAELERAEAKFKADRAALDRKLAKAQELMRA